MINQPTIFEIATNGLLLQQEVIKTKGYILKLLEEKKINFDINNLYQNNGVNLNVFLYALDWLIKRHDELFDKNLQITEVVIEKLIRNSDIQSHYQLSEIKNRLKVRGLLSIPLNDFTFTTGKENSHFDLVLKNDIEIQKKIEEKDDDTLNWIMKEENISKKKDLFLQEILGNSGNESENIDESKFNEVYYALVKEFESGDLEKKHTGFTYQEKFKKSIENNKQDETIDFMDFYLRKINKSSLYNMLDTQNAFTLLINDEYINTVATKTKNFLVNERLSAEIYTRRYFLKLVLEYFLEANENEELNGISNVFNLYNRYESLLHVKEDILDLHTNLKEMSLNSEELMDKSLELVKELSQRKEFNINSIVDEDIVKDWGNIIEKLLRANLSEVLLTSINISELNKEQLEVVKEKILEIDEEKTKWGKSLKDNPFAIKEDYTLLVTDMLFSNNRSVFHNDIELKLKDVLIQILKKPRVIVSGNAVVINKTPREFYAGYERKSEDAIFNTYFNNEEAISLGLSGNIIVADKKPSRIKEKQKRDIYSVDEMKEIILHNLKNNDEKVSGNTSLTILFEVMRVKPVDQNFIIENAQEFLLEEIKVGLDKSNRIQKPYPEKDELESILKSTYKEFFWSIKRPYKKLDHLSNDEIRQFCAKENNINELQSAYDDELIMKKLLMAIKNNTQVEFSKEKPENIFGFGISIDEDIRPILVKIINASVEKWEKEGSFSYIKALKGIMRKALSLDELKLEKLYFHSYSQEEQILEDLKLVVSFMKIAETREETLDAFNALEVVIEQCPEVEVALLEGDEHSQYRTANNPYYKVAIQIKDIVTKEYKKYWSESKEERMETMLSYIFENFNEDKTLPMGRRTIKFINQDDLYKPILELIDEFGLEKIYLIINSVHTQRLNCFKNNYRFELKNDIDENIRLQKYLEKFVSNNIKKEELPWRKLKDAGNINEHLELLMFYSNKIPFLKQFRERLLRKDFIEEHILKDFKETIDYDEGESKFLNYKSDIYKLVNTDEEQKKEIFKLATNELIYMNKTIENQDVFFAMGLKSINNENFSKNIVNYIETYIMICKDIRKNISNKRFDPCSKKEEHIDIFQELFTEKCSAEEKLLLIDIVNKHINQESIEKNNLLLLNHNSINRFFKKYNQIADETIIQDYLVEKFKQADVDTLFVLSKTISSLLENTIGIFEKNVVNRQVENLSKAKLEKNAKISVSALISKNLTNEGFIFLSEKIYRTTILPNKINKKINFNYLIDYAVENQSPTMIKNLSSYVIENIDELIRYETLFVTYSKTGIQGSLRYQLTKNKLNEMFKLFDELLFPQQKLSTLSEINKIGLASPVNTYHKACNLLIQKMVESKNTQDENTKKLTSERDKISNILLDLIRMSKKNTSDALYLNENLLNAIIKKGFAHHRTNKKENTYLDDIDAFRFDKVAVLSVEAKLKYIEKLVFELKKDIDLCSENQTKDQLEDFNNIIGVLTQGRISSLRNKDVNVRNLYIEKRDNSTPIEYVLYDMALRKDLMDYIAIEGFNEISDIRHLIKGKDVVYDGTDDFYLIKGFVEPYVNSEFVDFNKLIMGIKELQKIKQDDTVIKLIVKRVLCKANQFTIAHDVHHNDSLGSLDLLLKALDIQDQQKVLDISINLNNKVLEKIVNVEGISIMSLSHIGVHNIKELPSYNNILKNMLSKSLDENISKSDIRVEFKVVNAGKQISVFEDLIIEKMARNANADFAELINKKDWIIGREKQAVYDMKEIIVNYQNNIGKREFMVELKNSETYEVLLKSFDKSALKDEMMNFKRAYELQLKLKDEPKLRVNKKKI